jgi:hypothetical protein
MPSLRVTLRGKGGGELGVVCVNAADIVQCHVVMQVGRYRLLSTL